MIGRTLHVEILLDRKFLFLHCSVIVYRNVNIIIIVIDNTRYYSHKKETFVFLNWSIVRDSSYTLMDKK
jgi:hypothetical protein